MYLIPLCVLVTCILHCFWVHGLFCSVFIFVKDPWIFFVECHTFWIYLTVLSCHCLICFSVLCVSCKQEGRFDGLIRVSLNIFWQENFTNDAAHFVLCPTKREIKSDHPPISDANSVSSLNFLSCLTPLLFEK